MQIKNLTALETGRKIRKREISVTEAVKASLEQIEKLDPAVGSFVTVDEERALKRAEQVQKQMDRGELTGPLAGVPIGVKDNICYKRNEDYLQLKNPL